MKRQYTATLYIIKENKTLLVHHKKFNKWVPPGGHLLENETPFEGAIREAKEETGLDIALLYQENLWIEHNSFPRPYMCAIYNIPDLPNEKEHQHIDFIYVGTPTGGDEIKNETEIKDMKWFTISDIKKLKEHTYQEIIPTVTKILQDSDKFSLFDSKSSQK